VEILHAIVLGLVQGLTEFFPVSSSGHLAIVPWASGWDDFGDNEVLAKAFDVALHMGTFVGVVAYFRSDIVRFTRAGFTEPRSNDGRMAWLLLASAVPAALVGAIFSDTINRLDDEIGVIAVMLIVFGLILYVADRLPGDRQEEGFRLRDAAFMGLGQALALEPGVSRSGVTVSVARKLGFDRNASARLSFLMSLPIIAGAGVFATLDVMSEGGIPSEFWPPFLWGMAASAVTGWVAVWPTLKIVRTYSFTPFVIYRVSLGVLILVALAF
jgi:undecaprenyl-diphosphatase